MKQFLTILAVIFFMGISGYLLLNENKLMRSAHHRVEKKLVRSPSKLIGEKTRRDFAPYDLQRMRINSEASFRFENIGNNTVYELDEEELDKVAKQLSELKTVNDFDQNEFFPPADVVGTAKKEYYEIDGAE